MKLWRLDIKDPKDVGWNDSFEMIVSASSEEEARKAASKWRSTIHYSGDWRDIEDVRWLDPKRSNCKIIIMSAESAILSVGFSSDG